MRQHEDTLEVETPGRGLTDVTTRVAAIVADCGIRTGSCTLFIQHTSASLTVQENADPDVQRDLEDVLQARLAPDGPEPLYRHTHRGARTTCRPTSSSALTQSLARRSRSRRGA